MCGLAGFSGVRSFGTRLELVCSLGDGIDSRGGDAAGFVALTPTLQVSRKLGHWMTAKPRFLRRAAQAETCMLHARFATCGGKGIGSAHPFAVEREGRTVLYGAHNGVLHGTVASAQRHKRAHTVDSRELFELLADNLHDEISALEGYGVITWVDTRRPTEVQLARINESSYIYVCETECGAIVWGSTKNIVHDALQDAHMRYRKHFRLEIGAVYTIHHGCIWRTDDKRIQVADRKLVRVPWNWSGYAAQWEDYLHDDEKDEPPHDELEVRLDKEAYDDWLYHEMREKEREERLEAEKEEWRALMAGWGKT